MTIMICVTTQKSSKTFPITVFEITNEEHLSVFWIEKTMFVSSFLIMLVLFMYKCIINKNPTLTCVKKWN